VNDNALYTDLWNRIRNCEQEAVEGLYRALYFDLFNYGIHISGNVELTKDAINDIFLEIWEKREKLAIVSNVKSYLFTCIRRKIFSGIRLVKKKNRAILSFSESLSGQENSFEEYLVEKQSVQELKQRISVAIDSLTDRQKQLVQLRYFESLTVEDIARKTGLSAKTVYNTIYNVLKTLSSELIILVFFFILN
jgi:RNA polymerase sigma-70 factor (ECF subfamily)